ncbi:MAG: hypothetical protein CBC35_06530 [Planctomycetes bacterium TMED75]|nr:hypothetical protein [Planctomycetaceae bacterium]OUU92861.1 MAG: hypothetical protein CBC35_06530 [Planctomycetes bacterium TMED75]
MMQTLLLAVVLQEVVPPSIQQISPARIQANVDHLAQDELYGRYWLSPFAQEAAEWIQLQFEEAGIKPGLPDDAWFQKLPVENASPNVVGMIPGTDPKAGIIAIGAHYDHLPPRRRGEDKIYNGADDNASGTSGLIEIGRALVPLKSRLKASVLLIAFTGEEAGLMGSRHFVQEMNVDPKRFIGLFNLDMISRGEEDVIFIEGAAKAPQLIAALRRANRTNLQLKIDQHPDWLSRSDQWPFLEKGIPALLFSVEDHEDYHQVTDHADKIIASLASRVAQMVAMAVLDLAEEKTLGSSPPSEPGASESGVTDEAKSPSERDLKETDP